MTFTFLNAALLFGLVATAIPIIIHFLNRKRFEVIPWGAMQFLQFSEKTRRRMIIEDLLLLAMRMAVIAALVLSLAAPLAASTFFARFGAKGNQDVVIVIDGSGSMGFAPNKRSPSETAKEWASAFIDELRPGDSVAVVLARQRPELLVDSLSSDHDLARSALATLPEPRGGCDGPAAVQSALQLLSKSKRSKRSVIILSDNQRVGWSDDTTKLRWELFGQQRHIAAGSWFVNTDPDRPADAVHWSLGPIIVPRAVSAVQQTMTFRSRLVKRGRGDLPAPGRGRVMIDGQSAPDVVWPSKLDQLSDVPIAIQHKFTASGSHVVGLRIDDTNWAADVRQEVAVEVVKSLPVLLITSSAGDSPRSIDFINNALAPARDTSPTMLTKVVGENWDPSELTKDVGAAGTAPRVVVLSDVAKLTVAQQSAVTAFLAGGGGLLVCLGEHVDREHYTRELFRSGKGWLPAGLKSAEGDIDDMVKALQPVAASFFHPALELFKEPLPGSLADARFPRHWQLTPLDQQAVAIAKFPGDQLWLVEKPYKSGRVILATTPFDSSWNSDLISLPSFPPLMHELVSYLAGARLAEINVKPGQPIRWRGLPSAGDWNVLTPDSRVVPARVENGSVVFEATSMPGVYSLQNTAQAEPRFAVVQSDARESDLATFTDDDRKLLTNAVPNLHFANAADVTATTLSSQTQQQELWWLFLVFTTLLLATEVWYTRRRAMAIEGNIAVTIPGRIFG